MNERPRLTSPTHGSRSWLARTMLILAGAAVLLVGFFFLTVALVAGSLLAAVIALRWWWVMRRLRAERQRSAPLDGEYTVIDSVGSQRIER
jgi:predicted lipid-binding transport protein (Tim44 family)